MARVAVKENPYAAPGEITDGPPVYEMPGGREYAAPSLDEENGYIDSPILAWSPTLKEQPGYTPDPLRTGRTPGHDRRPYPTQPPENFWNVLDADDKSRHSVETQDADGFEEKRGILRRFAPNPRSIPSEDLRPTSRLSPHSYVFTRPMFGGPLHLTGIHFSMADHRRDYPVLGMEPVRTWRNTYRINPAPFDTDMVDLPPEDIPDVSNMRIRSVEVPAAANPWRL